MTLTTHDDINSAKRRKWEETAVKATPISRRLGIVYLERCRLRKKGQAVVVVRADGERLELPVAAIGGVILGPGTSVTAEASRVIIQRGCSLSFGGGGGLPVWSISTRYRSPTNKINQFKASLDDKKRMDMAVRLFEWRAMVIAEHDLPVPAFDGFQSLKSLEELLAMEGQWSKSAYASYGRAVNAEHLLRGFKIREATPIALGNYFLYSLASLVITHMGYDPNIGILHGQTRGGGLVFDLADVFKPLVTLGPSFKAAAERQSANHLKAAILGAINRNGIVDKMVGLLTELFGDTRKVKKRMRGV
jgi:CRISPR-associated protein Cas1